MKTIVFNSAILVLVYSGFYTSAQQTDPVESATAVNESMAEENFIDEDVAEFLVNSADARMMGSREGKLAQQKGTTSSIRTYGLLMVTDQATLLEELNKIAAKLRITLPSGISEKKESGREALASKTGKDFDAKFIKMMVIDHERDIKLFQKAIECKDRDVRAFAQLYLPMIQSHLEKINAIKKESKSGS